MLLKKIKAIKMLCHRYAMYIWTSLCDLSGIIAYLADKDTSDPWGCATWGFKIKYIYYKAVPEINAMH